MGWIELQKKNNNKNNKKQTNNRMVFFLYNLKTEHMVGICFFLIIFYTQFNINLKIRK